MKPYAPVSGQRGASLAYRLPPFHKTIGRALAWLTASLRHYLSLVESTAWLGFFFGGYLRMVLILILDLIARVLRIPRSLSMILLSQPHVICISVAQVQ